MANLGGELCKLLSSCCLLWLVLTAIGTPHMCAPTRASLQLATCKWRGMTTTCSDLGCTCCSGHDRNLDGVTRIFICLPWVLKC